MAGVSYETLSTNFAKVCREVPVVGSIIGGKVEQNIKAAFSTMHAPSDYPMLSIIPAYQLADMMEMFHQGGTKSGTYIKLLI